jgi:acetyl esterase/lipase
MQTGIPTELHCWPGTYHGFRVLGPESRIARTANALLMTALCRGLGIEREINYATEVVA